MNIYCWGFYYKSFLTLMRPRFVFHTLQIKPTANDATGQRNIFKCRGRWKVGEFLKIVKEI